MKQVRKDKAIQRLKELAEEASELNPEDGRSQEFHNWTSGVYDSFRYIFGEDGHEYSRLPSGHATTPSGIREYLKNLISQVESNLANVEAFWQDDGGESVMRSMDQREFSAHALDGSDKGSESKKVFVIHGRDEATRETVARFLERLELDPVILHEQANNGHTIIEKIECHSDVAFAVVLLTPDDVGGLKNERHQLKPRARQNVVLELGFFLGKLGRQRVCSLVKGDIEAPSDYDGVVYTNLDDAGGWKIKLVQELKGAGFQIDANRAFGA